MMRALYTGASGIKSHQTRMDVVGNNISNVNTTGYKSARATFSDMLSQNLRGATSGNGTVGATNPIQIGLGTHVASTDLMFRDGSVLSTGKNTDIAISGDGLFVVTKGNQTYYTRNGDFEFDAAGNYVLPGSGHFVQGWTATDGVIDTTGAVGNINVAIGQTMEAKATDNIDYLYNLDADVPMVTGISGGNQFTKTIKKEDVSEANPLPVTLGGKHILVTWVSDDMNTSENWVTNNDISLGDTTVEMINEDGKVVTATITPPSDQVISKGYALGTSNVVTKSSITEEYPCTANIAGDKYTVIGVDKNVDFGKEWFVKGGSAPAGSSTITITSGDDEVTLTLKEPLENTIADGQKITIETLVSTASKENPVTLTLSDGTTVTKTEGTYQIGNSLPITTTTTVYDSMGGAHEVPVYFVREGEYSYDVVSSTNKWLVSLSPDASLTKGQTTTTEFTDASGNTVTATLAATEIQFDSSGKLVTTSEEGGETSNSFGTLVLSSNATSVDPSGVETTVPVAQNVNLDFSELTQFAGSTTISANANGNLEGTLKEIQIDSSGTINGIYTNGVQRPEAQVALAHFTNAVGLFKTGTSLYQQSENSGVAVIGEAQSFGVTLTPGALEMSNVDVANEFADMIVTQRGFQSNAKIITVGDEMIETAVNMKR